jgi:hypothetical protein
MALTNGGGERKTLGKKLEPDIEKSGTSGQKY